MWRPARPSALIAQDAKIRENTDRQIIIREIATGKITRRFAGHRFDDDRIYGVEFSPDGRLVAFSGQNSSIAIYDMATGKQVNVFSGISKNAHPASFVKLTFSPDSRMLAGSEMYYGTVHMWEVVTGQEFRHFTGHNGTVGSLTFSPDGAQLLSGSNDSTGLVWDVTGQRAKRIASPLSPESLKAHWADLGSKKAELAQRAVGVLAALPKQTLPLYQQYLRPIKAVAAPIMEGLLGRLDDESFQERNAAYRELEEFGNAAEPGLRRALENSPSLEARRRIEALLMKLEQDPERLRNLRVLQAIEQSGTLETRDILRSLAEGAPGAWLTKEASAALERLGKRSATAPR